MQLILGYYCHAFISRVAIFTCGIRPEYECTIRQRLGSLAFGDKWFEITDDIPSLARTIVNLFQNYGLDFLEQFQTYEDVLSHYQKHGKLPFQNPERASLEAALIAHHIGNAELAHSLFQKATQQIIKASKTMLPNLRSAWATYLNKKLALARPVVERLSSPCNLRDDFATFFADRSCVRITNRSTHAAGYFPSPACHP
ncbi:MAG: hypothetical protein WDN00_18005 [Limisphaerales bacterium]